MSRATLYHEYSVSERDRGPLLEFVLSALETCGCRVLSNSRPDKAPFRVTFETPLRERLGIVVYAFLANDRPTKNRPADEHRFQVKYGSKDGLLHELWQDTLAFTLFVGIDPERKLFVGADPVLHSPTRFCISIEFKRRNVEQILEKGWSVWEREKKQRSDENPVEVLVGGRPEDFLQFVRFERAALGEDQGHRALVAERIEGLSINRTPDTASGGLAAIPIHALAREFELGEKEVLDLVAGARRLKMAVRGWVAEEHLLRALKSVPGVSDCVRLDEEGSPDIRLRFESSRPRGRVQERPPAANRGGIAAHRLHANASVKE